MKANLEIALHRIKSLLSIQVMTLMLFSIVSKHHAQSNDGQVLSLYERLLEDPEYKSLTEVEKPKAVRSEKLASFFLTIRSRQPLQASAFYKLRITDSVLYHLNRIALVKKSVSLQEQIAQTEIYYIAQANSTLSLTNTEQKSSNAFNSLLNEFIKGKSALYTLLREEKSFYLYEKERIEVESFYRSIKSSVLRCKQSLQAIENHRGEKGALTENEVTAFINQHASWLKKKLQYCDLQIITYHKIYQYPDTNAPTFAVYRGGLIPLFEQDQNTIAQKGDYVTLKITESHQAEKYLTGYRNLNGRKEAFIAKSSNGQIIWVTYLPEMEKAVDESADTYGLLISLTPKSCFALIHKTERGSGSENSIYEVDLNGEALKKIDIGKNELPLGAVFNAKDSTFFVVSERFDFSLQTPQKSIVLKKHDFEGKLIWENNLEQPIELVKVVHTKQSYGLVFNKPDNDSARGDQVQIPADRLEAKESIYLVKIDSNGKVTNSKTISIRQPIKANYASLVENSRLLIIGEVQRRAITKKKTFDLLIDLEGDFSILDSSI